MVLVTFVVKFSVFYILSDGDCLLVRFLESDERADGKKISIICCRSEKA